MSDLLSQETVRPTDLAAARKAVLDAGRDRAVLIRGGGTKLGWGGAPRGVALVVDTSGLDRFLSHDAADSTAVVEAGMPLARLQEQLAAHGQWLAIDPPDADAGATVGGVLAANDHGPRRHRYGGMRDLVIGVVLVTSDGAVARSGGRVIKNVAGYDLAKLLAGSLGTLALVAEVALRLHPLPPTSRTVRVPADPVAGTALTLALLAAPVVPSAVDHDGAALLVRLEGVVDASVTAQADTITALAAAHGLDAEVLAGDDEDAAWRAAAAGLRAAPGETLLRAATLPSHLADVAAALTAAADPVGVGARMVSHAGLGLHTIRLSGGDAAAHATVVRRLRRRVSELIGSVVVRDRPDALDGLVDVWGDAPDALAVMRRVKERLDPGGRLAPGRFVGGI